MAMIDDNSKNQIKTIFEQLKEQVNVVLIVKKEECETCSDTQTFVTEMTDISEKLTLEVLDESDDKAKEFGVTMYPAIILLDKDNKDYGIKFYGIPAGHEINSFIMGLIEVSGAGEQLPEDVVKKIEAINKPIDIKVFITLSCPHCPGAVAKAHKLAFMNKNVNAEMIEANTFGEISTKYNVSGVPKIVINEDTELLGDQPLNAFLSAIENL
ncbi:MAG: thioredoxin family protein [Clostridiales bacterium]|nr:thioredoxin family protein [Clostridiales bacterium]